MRYSPANSANIPQKCFKKILKTKINSNFLKIILKTGIDLKTCKN